MINYSFICDSMLGKLSRWLRVLGYDTFYSSNLSDEEIFTLVSSNVNRTLLTRDEKLFQKLINEGHKAILIKDNKITKQLSFLNKYLEINLDVDPNLSRCSFCNYPLSKVENNNNVKGLIPPRVREKNKIYWHCKNCNKVFWKGKMWPNIEKITNMAKMLSKN